MAEQDEWGFLTFDPEQACAICGEPVRTGQAVGYNHGQVVHARCSLPRDEGAAP